MGPRLREFEAISRNLGPALSPNSVMWHALDSSYLKGDDARVVVVQSGEDVVGIGAEGGWNGGGGD